MTKVCFCVPVYRRPEPEFLDSIERSIPLVLEAGFEEGSAWEIGNAYISYARSLLIKKAIKWGADQIVFLDADVSHEPGDLLKLLETPGDIVAGTYRFRSPIEEYMGKLEDPEPVPRSDGIFSMELVPAGFLKISRTAIEMMIRKYPDLDFSREEDPLCYDLFRHGTMRVNERNTWFGEDYAFSIRWRAMGQTLWLQPDLSLGHHGRNMDGKDFHFPGNFKNFLEKNPAKLRTENGMGLLE